MRGRFASALGAAVVSVLLASCGSVQSSGPSYGPIKTGLAVVRLEAIGGPWPGFVPVSGQVNLRNVNPDARATLVTMAIGKSGTVTSHAPVGTWQVTATSPEVDHNRAGFCAADRWLVVREGRTSSLLVKCHPTPSA